MTSQPISPLNIALAQINPIVGDIDYNSDKILNYINQAHKELKADLVVFPELAICGYLPQDLVRKSCFIKTITEAVNAIIEKTAHLEIGIILPCPIHEDGKTYNGAHVIYQGEIIGTTRKHHLPNYGVFDEQRYFDAADMPEPITFKGNKLGILICEDLWHMDVASHLKSRGADMLIIPNGSPYCAEKAEMRLYYSGLRTSETGLPIIYVNQVGGQDEMMYDGGSFVMNVDGGVTQQLPYFEEALTSFLDPSTSNGKIDHLELNYKALVIGTHDYIVKNGFSKVVLGLSGGIDSAIVAAIAVDALGAENVHTIMMPTRFTSDESLDDAKACAENLGCSYEIIPIKKPLAAFEQSIEGLEGLAHENIQSRIRGTILMAHSNKTGALLLSTGNKSEMACGYATLYGDMNGAFNPLKDVYKTKVFALAKWRNRNGEIIPERIITKPPSAELRDYQKDSDSLPDYDILDDILEGLIEEETSIDDLVARGYDRDLVMRIYKMLTQSEYKRFQSAPGPKITNKAFGTDRRVPMTNGFLRSKSKSTD